MGDKNGITLKRNFELGLRISVRLKYHRLWRPVDCCSVGFHPVFQNFYPAKRPLFYPVAPSHQGLPTCLFGQSVPTINILKSRGPAPFPPFLSSYLYSPHCYLLSFPPVTSISFCALYFFPNFFEVTPFSANPTRISVCQTQTVSKFEIPTMTNFYPTTKMHRRCESEGRLHGLRSKPRSRPLWSTLVSGPSDRKLIVTKHEGSHSRHRRQRSSGAAVEALASRGRPRTRWWRSVWRQTDVHRSLRNFRTIWQSLQTHVHTHTRMHTHTHKILMWLSSTTRCKTGTLHRFINPDKMAGYNDSGK